jgi:hypothetical protein
MRWRTSKVEKSHTNLEGTRKLSVSRMKKQLNLFLEALMRNRASRYCCLDRRVEKFIFTITVKGKAIPVTGHGGP